MAPPASTVGPTLTLQMDGSNSGVDQICFCCVSTASNRVQLLRISIHLPSHPMFSFSSQFFFFFLLIFLSSGAFRLLERPLSFQSVAVSSLFFGFLLLLLCPGFGQKACIFSLHLFFGGGLEFLYW